MVRSGVQPDDITFGAVLHACSSLAVLGHAKMVHGCILHYGFHAYVCIGNSLVNTYAKCGDLLQEGSEESRVVFETMGSVYGISPEMDHVACMVDMLGRGGYLAEAKELIDKYSGVGSAQMSLCEALFGAYFAQGNVGVGRNSGQETSYVLLSNLYFASGQWKETEMVGR
ncbi:hypothetical protein L3X38_033201 [Prunus dulcis]|uniref:Tetratricopeptide repeat-like superfamily protein n=1 Tax=Prunus dulcis TaxID=3755 RepID=A0AAD4YXE1_PRUDU|nr:hypothetical protein L3X38_033201 [Prunus dulcis]